MALVNPKHKKARALKMLESKIMKGKTNKEIAEEFGVSPDTVRKCLTLAEKADIVVDFEDKLYGQLLPLAHDAVMGALQEGNAKIGLAIMQGTQVLRPQNGRTAAQAVEDDELARYIAQKRLAAQMAQDTLDGQIVQPGAPKELPSHVSALPAAQPSSHPSDSPQDLLPGPQPPLVEAAGTPSGGPESSPDDESHDGDQVDPNG